MIRLTCRYEERYESCVYLRGSFRAPSYMTSLAVGNI